MILVGVKRRGRVEKKGVHVREGSILVGRGGVIILGCVAQKKGAMRKVEQGKKDTCPSGRGFASGGKSSHYYSQIHGGSFGVGGGGGRKGPGVKTMILHL